MAPNGPGTGAAPRSALIGPRPYSGPERTEKRRTTRRKDSKPSLLLWPQNATNGPKGAALPVSVPFSLSLPSRLPFPFPLSLSLPTPDPPLLSPPYLLPCAVRDTALLLRDRNRPGYGSSVRGAPCGRWRSAQRRCCAAVGGPPIGGAVRPSWRCTAVPRGAVPPPPPLPPLCPALGALPPFSPSAEATPRSASSPSLRRRCYA